LYIYPSENILSKGSRYVAAFLSQSRGYQKVYISFEYKDILADGYGIDQTWKVPYISSTILVEMSTDMSDFSNLNISLSIMFEKFIGQGSLGTFQVVLPSLNRIVSYLFFDII